MNAIWSNKMNYLILAALIVLFLVVLLTPRQDLPELFRRLFLTALIYLIILKTGIIQ
jgi:hypothetical protein